MISNGRPWQKKDLDFVDPGGDGGVMNDARGGQLRRLIHVLDDVVTEFRAFDLGGTLHEAGEVVGDAF